MSMQGTITTHDGCLCVLYETAHHDEPKVTRLWWAVQRTIQNAYGWERPKVGDTARYQGDGHWHTNDAETLRSTGGVSTGTGQTDAIHRETVDAPDPKIRRGVERRWKDGRWQKCLKQGWVNA